MWRTGLELRAHGHPNEAHELFERSVAWFRSRPEEEAETPAHRAAFGAALYAAGRWDEAEQLFQQLLAEFPEEYDILPWSYGGSVEYQGYLGVLAARRGEAEKAVEISEKLGNLDLPWLYGRHIFWRACIAAVLGERERAVEFLRDAFGAGWSYYYSTADRHANINLESLRDYRPFQELMRPKG